MNCPVSNAVCPGCRLIYPYLTGRIRGIHAAIFNFLAGVMAPMSGLGRSFFQVQSHCVACSCASSMLSMMYWSSHSCLSEWIMFQHPQSAQTGHQSLNIAEQIPRQRLSSIHLCQKASQKLSATRQAARSRQLPAEHVIETAQPASTANSPGSSKLLLQLTTASWHPSFIAGTCTDCASVQPDFRSVSIRPHEFG